MGSRCYSCLCEHFSVFTTGLILRLSPVKQWMYPPEVTLVAAILLQLAQNTLKDGHAILLWPLKGIDSQI